MISYRTFDELVSSVSSDFELYAQEGFINPQDLIKIAQYINKKLGLKIHSPKNQVLDVSKGRAKLPNDFQHLSFAIMMAEGSCTITPIQGDQRELVVLPCGVKGGVMVNDCGNHIEVVQTVTSYTRTWKRFNRLKIIPSNLVSPHCMNTRIHSIYEAELRDGWIYTNFEEGQIYISYFGDLVDDDGNLLVLDHDIINNWYEDACKVKILEKMLSMKEDVVGELKYYKEERRKSKIEALSVAFMPGFMELGNIWRKNREIQYQNYYRKFQC